MAGSQNQKQKLLVLLMILWEFTDEEHALTMEELRQKLQNRGITAERKGLYEDMDILRDLGFCVCFARNKGYWLDQRLLSSAELRLLVDAVQASRFVSEEESARLITKLEKLLSVHQARTLQHAVIIRERVKSSTADVFASVAILQDALAEKRQITFRYFEWDVRKKKVLRHEGRQYRVSPLALVWEDENYYLVAVDETVNEQRHYRVDKMLDIEKTDDVATGDNTRFDTGAFAKRMFGMFGGNTVKVKLRCTPELVGVVLDRFGLQTILAKEPDGTVSFIAEVTDSPVFLSWVFQFNGRMTIVSPESLKEKMRDMALAVLEDTKEKGENH